MLEELFSRYLEVITVIGVFVTFLFLISVIIKRNDIADVAWGFGIFLVALTSYRFGVQNEYTLLLTVLAGLWGLRLTWRIFRRNRKKGEDVRYKKWRDNWGQWFYLRSFFQVYVLQGFLMTVVGFGFVFVSVHGADLKLGVATVVGVLVWLIGYYFEVVGDWQLDRFLVNPENRGRVMKRGLWRFTRHPNYFGEVVMWWGVWLVLSPLTMSYLALISPLVITYLIFKVSGIPMLEETMSKDPQYQQYMRETNQFFPWRPKLESKSVNGSGG